MFLLERNQKEKVNDPGGARVGTAGYSLSECIDRPTRLNHITHCVPRLKGFLFLFYLDENAPVSLPSLTELGPVCHNYCD